MYRYRTIPNQRPVQQTGTVVVAFSFSFFFLVCEDFGRMFDNSLPACAFFV